MRVARPGPICKTCTQMRNAASCYIVDRMCSALRFLQGGGKGRGRKGRVRGGHPTLSEKH